MQEPSRLLVTSASGHFGCAAGGHLPDTLNVPAEWGIATSRRPEALPHRDWWAQQRDTIAAA